MEDDGLTELMQVVEQFERRERIKVLSDQQLSHYYVILSNPAHVAASLALIELEAELRVRGLPLGLLH